MQFSISIFQKYAAIAATCFLLTSTQGRAQNSSHSSDLPSAPGPASALLDQDQASGTPQSPSGQSSNSNADGQQTKRILGIIPNFRAVSADAHLPPQTVKDKFTSAALDSFDYSAFIFVGILAGVGQAQNSYPEFGQGAVGYGRYYWHTLADQTNENLQVEFLWPVALHQDTRYYTLGHGGFFKRTGYSFSRIFITRTDGGNRTFNASEIMGAGSAAGISNLYYPSADRSWTKTGQRWVTNVSLDGLTFIAKEFWPDINNKIFHQKD